MNYHAHIYYRADTKSEAQKLRALIQVTYPHLPVSPMVDYAVGPHLYPMFQVGLSDRDLDVMIREVKPFSQTLSILFHPLIRDDLIAHTDEAMWIGKPLPVNVEFLSALPSR